MEKVVTDLKDYEVTVQKVKTYKESDDDKDTSEKPSKEDDKLVEEKK